MLAVLDTYIIIRCSYRSLYLFITYKLSFKYSRYDNMSSKNISAQGNVMHSQICEVIANVHDSKSQTPSPAKERKPNPPKRGLNNGQMNTIRFTI